MALLHLLHSCKNLFSFTLHVAYVDHFWREEGKEEKKTLETLVKSLGHRFHYLKLCPPQDWHNLEERYREMRFLALKDLYDRCQCQALLLGHHKNDLVETVIKRWFEGAKLTKLYGIKKITLLYGMQVWRPLLSLSKKNLLAFLTENQLPWFEDPTNQDARFLRSRMRQKLLPQLESAFGKGIENNLYRFSQEIEKVHLYLDLQIQPFWEKILWKKSGCKLALEDLPAHDIERQHLLLKMAKNYSITLNHNNIEIILSKLKEGLKGKKHVSVCPPIFSIDKSYLHLRLQ